MPWGELLDAAYRLGIDEDRFWRMNMRKLNRAIDAFGWRQRVRRLALHNTIGPMLHAGDRPFEPLAMDDLDRPRRTQGDDSLTERWARIEAKEQACIERHAALKSSRDTSE